MKNNPLIVIVLFAFGIAFTGCNKYTTCILWQEGDYVWRWRFQFENVKSEPNLKCCKHKIKVVRDREEIKLYTKQMVVRMIDTLLYYTADIKKVEIYPVEGDLNTRKEGAYILAIDYTPEERIMAWIFSDGTQFVLPHPEEIIEIRKGIEVSDSIRAMREDKRAAIAHNFFKNIEVYHGDIEAFITGYHKYRWDKPIFDIR